MKLIVTDREGTLEEIPALSGWSVMEILRDAGMPVKAECGGCCACATCHVYVAPEWQDAVGSRSDEEDHIMDDAFDVRPNSRLSCQILFRDDLDGLHVTLAPE